MTSSNVNNRIEYPWQNDQGLYRDVREIGSGAYGVVMRSVNVSTGREVAIKKIRVQLTEDGVPQSVIREISCIKQLEYLSHPNIIKLFDVCHGMLNDRDLYINLVFELCLLDLAAFLDRMKPPGLNETKVKDYMLQLLSGLDFLHSNSIVHRDLKPQNILIAADGKLKLTDFGLSRIYSMQSTMTTIVVTLWYRSPEVLLQCGYNTSVDIWSLGCIFVEMYNLQALFKGATEKDQLEKIFEISGLPPLVDWPKNAVILRDSFPHFPKVPFVRVAPGMSFAALDLLEQFLKFLPSKRITVAKAMKHSYFAGL